MELNNKELLPLIEKYLENAKKLNEVTSEKDIQNLIVKTDKYLVMPSFCDVHVHFREPGYTHKASIKSESLSAASGGYTTVFTMPNLKPVPDSLENLQVQLEAIRKDSVIEVIPYGSITKNQAGEELSNMDELAGFVGGFSDDGKGVQNNDIMKTAMLKAKELNLPIVAHCEDNSLLFSGYIHDGEYAKLHGHKGICSASEYKQVERDIELVKKTGVKYHVCHISTKETVDLIRNAKKEGVNISCETAPHYLIYTDMDLKEEGRFKMNPPIRSEEDKNALIQGIIDGTIDVIATDHAPHSKEEKSKGLKDSFFGIVGLETAFSAVYTNLVKTGVITLEKLVYLLSVAPRKRFNLTLNTSDYTVFEIKTPYKIDSNKFLSAGKSTPFDGEIVFGDCLLTAKNGNIVYQK